MDSIVAAIAKTENIAILVLVLVCFGLYQMLQRERREARDDRTKDNERNLGALDRNTEALTKVGEALTEIRITIASIGGGK